MEQELTEMCRVIFTAPINSEISNTTITKMVNFAKTGALPFKANAIDDVVYDNMNYDLGVIDLGEYMIYDSLKTGKVDGEIVMTRYLRFTKGEGENIQELDIEL
jgi:hypothetical protein